MEGNNPSQFAKEFEAKFLANKDKPRMEFLIAFRPREFHFYILVITELQPAYRRNAPYADMVRKFPPSHWQDAVLGLLKKFAKRPIKGSFHTKKEDGRSFVAAACMHFPEFFADHLDTLFLARIPFPGHITSYMWQQFGVAYGTFLHLYVDTNTDDFGEQCRALSMALLTGDRELVRWAKDFIRHQLDMPRKKTEGLYLAGELLNKHLVAQGMEWRGNDLRQLYSPVVYHIVFPPKYLLRSMEHETYRKLAPLPDYFIFGGSLVARNQKGLQVKVQHLLKLDPIPAGLHVTGMHRLLIACDLERVLLERGAAYQQHHPAGGITLLQDERERLPEGKASLEPRMELVKTAKVLLSQQGPAWFYQRDGQEQNLNRVGGPPIFIKEVHYPDCIRCGKPMNFLLQIDDGLPLANDKALEWGQGGMAYVYWCDRCKVSAVQAISD